MSFVPVYSALPRRVLERFGLNRALELYFGIGPDESGKLLSMLVFDSVIANKDRHFGNFGLLRDNRTGELLGMAPLFDHNLSLFCGEPDSTLDLDDLLAARRRYSGTFATNLEAQLGFAMEDTQREQVARLFGFEFEVPAGFLDRGADVRSVLTSARLFPTTRARSRSAGRATGRS